MSEQQERLYDEILFTKWLLGHGLTYLRKACFTDKGIYFDSFNSLSLGLERLCKICIILDYIKREGKYPESNYITKFGHNLEKLIIKLESISINKCEFTKLHRLIISHLSKFADSKGRYSNINFITNGATQDPIDEWSKIDQYIIEHSVTSYDKKRCKKSEKHYQFGNTIPTIALGYESDKRKNINSSDDFFHQYAKFELVSGYRVLFLIQIIQKLFNVLEGINTNLPKEFYLWELDRVFSVFFYGTDSEKRKRRNFMR